MFAEFTHKVHMHTHMFMHIHTNTSGSRLVVPLTRLASPPIIIIVRAE